MRLRRFSGLSVRNLGARRQRTLLTAAGIVLGVGIVFGVLTLSAAMSSSFSDLFTRAYGAADITITAAGGNGPFKQENVQRVREIDGVESAAPRLSEGSSLLASNDPRQAQSMRVFGVEPRTAALATDFDIEEGRYPQNGGELALDSSSADNLGLGLGDRVRVATPEGAQRVRIVGILQLPGGFAGSAFGMVSLPYAQKVFDQPGKVTGIAVEASGDDVGPLLKRLEDRLGEGLQAERSANRTQEAVGQLQSFSLTLLFFAGTAMFVGGFLVFNALSMTVLERTRELGMLRALGSTRAMISRSIVLEALVLGLAGSLLGLLLGYGMARGLLLLFGRSFQFGVPQVSISAFPLVAAVVTGVVITVIAALYPALRAGGTSPVEAMRAVAARGPSASRGASIALPLAGLALVGAGAPWTYYLARNFSANLEGWLYASGIAGVIGTFLGVSLIIPSLIRPLSSLFSPLLRALFGVEGRMAAINSTRNRGRTALTASALMVGIALVISFSALGTSVLGSIRDYLQGSLGSDYIVQPANQTSDAEFSPRLTERVGSLDGVERTTSVATTVRHQDEQTSFVLGVNRSYPQVFDLQYASGGSGSFSKLLEGEAIVGQQYAETNNLKVGSRFTLPGLGGEQSYRVAGILKNDIFGGGTGIYLSKGVLEEDFGVNSDSLLAVKAAPGADRQALERQIEGLLTDYPQLALYSSAEWKQEIIDQFNRIYVFFYAIMGVSVAVSAFGVINTLSMSVFERTREIGVLRAVGSTRLQVGRLIIEEGVVISLIGCILGVAVGSLLGYLFVEGSAAGGFEIAFHYPGTAALGALGAGLAIGVLAGLLPARAAARTNIVEAVQYE